MASRVFASIITSTVWPINPSIELSTVRLSPMYPTLTAMTTSAPIFRTMSAGTLFKAPPSTRTRPSTSIGGKMPGNDIVARIASASEP